MSRQVVVNDVMQKGYVYTVTEPAGRNFDPDFRPQLSPKEMLKLGVFGGKYMTDCTTEFPADWFEHAKLSRERHDEEVYRVIPVAPTDAFLQHVLATVREQGGLAKSDRIAVDVDPPVEHILAGETVRR